MRLGASIFAIVVGALIALGLPVEPLVVGLALVALGVACLS